MKMAESTGSRGLQDELGRLCGGKVSMVNYEFDLQRIWSKQIHHLALGPIAIIAHYHGLLEKPGRSSSIRDTNPHVEQLNFSLNFNQLLLYQCRAVFFFALPCPGSESRM